MAVIGLLLAGVALGVASTAGVTGDDAAVNGDHALVIGKISANPKKHYGYLKPIADYAASRMADLDITHAKVLIAKNNRQMSRYLRRGQVDWVTETPFSSMILKEMADAEFLLRKWKKGVAEYHSLVFVRADSGIKKLDDLKGKTIVFEDRGSTSAFYVPAYVLLKEGLKLEELDSPRERPSEDTVGYVFGKDEINMSTWVHKGIVDAGAYSNLDWEEEDDNPPAFRDDFSVLHRSRNFPRAVELVRSDLPEAVKQRLKNILRHSHEDPAAAGALQAYQQTKKFDDLDAADLAALVETKAIRMIVDEARNP